VSTHAALGVKHRDGEISGCYVHYDGNTMRSRIVEFIEKYTTTALTILIVKAQGHGGLRSFPPADDGCFLDDNMSYVIDKSNWLDDHYGASYRYLVDYKTGQIDVWRKHG